MALDTKLTRGIGPVPRGNQSSRGVAPYLASQRSYDPDHNSRSYNVPTGIDGKLDFTGGNDRFAQAQELGRQRGVNITAENFAAAEEVIAVLGQNPSEQEFNAAKRSGKLHRAAAFTLVELMVVIAIIGILISVLLPALGNARKAAKQTLCLSNMHQQAIASDMYTGESNGKLVYTFAMGGDESNIISQAAAIAPYPAGPADIGLLARFSQQQKNPRFLYCPMITEGFFAADGSYGVTAFSNNQDAFAPEFMRGTTGGAPINIKKDSNAKPSGTAYISEDPVGVTDGPMGHIDKTGHTDNISVLYLDSHAKLWNKNIPAVSFFGIGPASWYQLDE